MLDTDSIAACRAAGIDPPPTQDDLPSDDNQVMETQRHKLQMDLLLDAFNLWLADREAGYAGGNMFVYFSLEQVKNQDYTGPDFFAVLGVPKGERKSWVSWQEGKSPDVIVELLSPSTAEADKTTKLAIYRDRARTPEYFWFDPFAPDDWAGFALQGNRYVPIQPDERGCLPSGVLGLALARWPGTYQGVTCTWLRWADAEGRLLPTAAEKERDRAERERDRADRLAAKLRELGVDPEAI